MNSSISRSLQLRVDRLAVQSNDCLVSRAGPSVRALPGRAQSKPNLINHC